MAPTVAAGLHERERQRAARLLRHAPQDRELGVRIREVRDDLQHALAARADRLRDPDQLVGLGRERRRGLAPAGAVVQSPRRREAERAGLDRLSRQLRHERYVLGARDFALGAALPHHVQPQRAVRDLDRDVDVEGPAVERVHELGEGLPGPGQALVEHRARDVLDPFHQLDQPPAVGRPDRREADPAVAGDDRRDPVPGRRDHPLTPRRLAVVVGMDVDEPRRDEEAGRVDRPGRRPSIVDATLVMRLPSTATSPTHAGIPVPSTTVPPRMIRSWPTRRLLPGPRAAPRESAAGPRCERARGPRRSPHP